MPFDLRSVLKRSRAGADALFSGLEEIRRQIIVEKEALATVQSQPADNSTAIARLDMWLAKIESADAVGNLVHRLRADGYREPSAAEFSAVVLASVSSQIRDTVQKQIERHAASAPGLSDQQRERALASHREQLLLLELAEEATIREAERAGLEILRRSDADVRAVLADEEEFARCR